MRVLVCGGRTFGKLNRYPDGNPIRDDEKAAEYRFGMDWLTRYFMDYLMDPYEETRYGELVIIHGNAKGGDTIAKDFATVHWLHEEPFPADWDRYRKRAGRIRNQQMLDEGKPDVVIAFPGGTGTRDMIRRARTAGVEVIEVDYKPKEAVPAD